VRSPPLHDELVQRGVEVAIRDRAVSRLVGREQGGLAQKLPDKRRADTVGALDQPLGLGDAHR
jgi:hypothetical protein